MQREQAWWGRYRRFSGCSRAPGQRVAGKAVDLSTRFVALVRGCECLKKVDVAGLHCRRVLTMAASRHCLENKLWGVQEV